MTKQQYAALYDARAAAMYRFALLALGDRAGAEQAVAASFRGGWESLCIRRDDPALVLLRQLWLECSRRAPRRGRERAAGLRAALAGERLPDLMADLYWDERGLLLLDVLFGLDKPAMAEVTRLPVLRVERRRCQARERLALRGCPV